MGQAPPQNRGRSRPSRSRVKVESRPSVTAVRAASVRNGSDDEATQAKDATRRKRGARAERREAKRREAKRRSEATKRSRATAHEKEEISGEKKGKRLVNESKQNIKYFKNDQASTQKAVPGTDGGLCLWSPPKIGNSGKNCSYLSAK